MEITNAFRSGRNGKKTFRKAVIDLGMMSAAFDSSSESSNRFTYAMYVAGAAYMCCDIVERSSQMQGLGGGFQDVIESVKSNKDKIADAAFAALGVVGTIAISQTSSDKAEGLDVYKQVPVAVIAGVASFLYLQSSKAIESVTSKKKMELHEREVAEPFEAGITDAITILNGRRPQAQNQTGLLQELRDSVDGKLSQLGQANQEMTNLGQSIIEKDKKYLVSCRKEIICMTRIKISLNN